MTTPTLTTALTSVRELLDEPTARAWSDTELTRWINEACRDMCRTTEVLQTKADISITAGTQEYTAPTDAVRIYRAEYTRTGESTIYPLEYRDFNAVDAVAWTQRAITQSTPFLFTMWGVVPSLKITLYPKPSSAGTLTVYYYRLPTAVSGGSDTLDIPQGWEDAVYAYVEYRALRRDRDPRWQEAKAEYDEKVQNLYTLSRRLTDQAGVVTPYQAVGLPTWLVGEW